MFSITKIFAIAAIWFKVATFLPKLSIITRAQIKITLKKTLFNSDLETTINCTILTIDPTSYAQLQKAQPTSVAVEKSFSMLSKLLTKDRKYDVENEKMYYAVLQ